MTLSSVLAESSDRSQLVSLTLSGYGMFWEKVKSAFGTVTEEEELVKIVQVVGWEPNERGKAGPRLADLRASLNPHSLINQATDLNLHLMKWRLWPELDTQLVQNTRCLLLGAGTLGCAVGRLLLGYGVRSITFVDSGKVNYSTPTRQCLYTSEDCLNGVFKATQAANRLIEVNPTVKARGEVLAIPMPGHPILSSDSATLAADGESRCLEGEAALLRFEQLVEDHDVVFALTDSREARSVTVFVYILSIPFDSVGFIRSDRVIIALSDLVGCLPSWPKLEERLLLMPRLALTLTWSCIMAFLTPLIHLWGAISAMMWFRLAIPLVIAHWISNAP